MNGSLDPTGAPAASARLAVAAVDAESVLEVAERAIRGRKVAQRRTTRRDRFLQNLAHGPRQFAEARATQRARRRVRGDRSTVQRLADVDVAKSGDHALVEEHRLHRLPPRGEPARQIRSIEVRPQRFRTKALEPRMFRLRLGGY